MALKLSIYDIIKGPCITSKAYLLNHKLQQLVLEVHPQANKPIVEEALKKLFNVEVEKIRIVIVKGKNRRAGRRHAFTTAKRKKAIITLKEGYDVNSMGLNNSVEPVTVSAE